MRHFAARAAAPFAAALPVALAACTPSLSVDPWRAPPLDVGRARALVVVAGEGRPRAVDAAVAAVVAEARADGWYDVDGRRDGDALTVVVDVTEHYASDSTDTTTVVDAQGAAQTTVVVTTTATTRIVATVIAPDGDVLADALELEGTAELARDASEPVDVDALLDASARVAARGLLDQATPVRTVVDVRLDDEDEGQRPILAQAQEGALQPALAKIRAYAAAHDVASATYNEGAILDALGRHDEALAAYDAAILRSSKAWYAQTRADCAARAEAAAALGL